MESTNVPRIKRHFGKHSFGNSIFPAHWEEKKKKPSTARSQEKRGEKQPLPKQANSSQQKKINSN